jgi:hypothetical protein
MTQASNLCRDREGWQQQPAGPPDLGISQGFQLTNVFLLANHCRNGYTNHEAMATFLPQILRIFNLVCHNVADDLFSGF